jgi:hypothetical protein
MGGISTQDRLQLLLCAIVMANRVVQFRFAFVEWYELLCLV